MGNKVAADAAVLGMIFVMGAQAAETDAKNIKSGATRMYSKEELVFALEGMAKLLDKAANTILALCDELQPEVAEARDKVNDIFKEL